VLVKAMDLVSVLAMGSVPVEQASGLEQGLAMETGLEMEQGLEQGLEPVLDSSDPSSLASQPRHGSRHQHKAGDRVPFPNGTEPV